MNRRAMLINELTIRPGETPHAALLRAWDHTVHAFRAAQGSAWDRDSAYHYWITRRPWIRAARLWLDLPDPADPSTVGCGK